MSQNTNDEAEKKMYIQKAFEVLNNGNKYIPKNVSETLSAEDIAKKLKTTATKIGKLANAHNLKQLDMEFIHMQKVNTMIINIEHLDITRKQ